MIRYLYKIEVNNYGRKHSIITQVTSLYTVSFYCDDFYVGINKLPFGSKFYTGLRYLLLQDYERRLENFFR